MVVSECSTNVCNKCRPKIQTTNGISEIFEMVKSMLYLIDDASPANSETTLMSTFVESLYFDVANDVVLDACVILVRLVLLIHSTVVLLIRILLPLPSSRCSFGKWFVDGTIVVFDLTVLVAVLSAVSRLSSVELDIDAALDAALNNGLPTVAIASVFCVVLAFTF